MAGLRSFGFAVEGAAAAEVDEKEFGSALSELPDFDAGRNEKSPDIHN